MVPPQFTPYRASRDPNRSAGCIGPSPSSPTVFQRSHSERYSTSRLSLPCTHRQFSGKAFWMCTGFHHCVWQIFLLFYHFSLVKSTIIFASNTFFHPLRTEMQTCWIPRILWYNDKNSNLWSDPHAYRLSHPRISGQDCRCGGAGKSPLFGGLIPKTSNFLEFLDGIFVLCPCAAGSTIKFTVLWYRGCVLRKTI